MALSKITFEDKIALNPQPEVAEVNKVTDSDMNQIKSVVNAGIDDTNKLEDYSQEQKIGTWVDGKPLYRKVISDTLGTTNGAWKEISGVWGANEIKYVVSFNGMFSYSNGNNYSIPFTRVTSDNYSSREFVLLNVMPGTGAISVVAYHPSSYNLMSGRPFYATILYTKTSDYS